MWWRDNSHKWRRGGLVRRWTIPGPALQNHRCIILIIQAGVCMFTSESARGRNARWGRDCRANWKWPFKVLSGCGVRTQGGLEGVPNTPSILGRTRASKEAGGGGIINTYINFLNVIFSHEATTYIQYEIWLREKNKSAFGLCSGRFLLSNGMDECVYTRAFCVRVWLSVHVRLSVWPNHNLLTYTDDSESIKDNDVLKWPQCASCTISDVCLAVTSVHDKSLLLWRANKSAYLIILRVDTFQLFVQSIQHKR